MHNHGAFSHQAILYRNPEEYVSAVAGFVSAGASKGEPALIAVPRPRGVLLKRVLAGVRGVQFVDITDLSRNPGRLLATELEFLGPNAEPSRIVGEAILTRGDSASAAKAVRHETLVNLALEGWQAQMLCLFDSAVLSPATVADVWRTHPQVIVGGNRVRSSSYRGPGAVIGNGRRAFEAAPSRLHPSDFSTDDLAALRRGVEAHAEDAHLSVDRAQDLVLAVDELASTLIQLDSSPPHIRLWNDPAGAVVCEVFYPGRTLPPQAGRYAPGPDGDVDPMWLVNQLCDLVEVQSAPQGSKVRIRVGR